MFNVVSEDGVTSNSVDEAIQGDGIDVIKNVNNDEEESH